MISQRAHGVLAKRSSFLAACCDCFSMVPVESAETEEHSCCGGHHHRASTETASAAAARRPAKKYFCSMCEGVESDAPGTCPKCGMALERNPLVVPNEKTIFTCPMHPQIEQDHPSACPICGMALEPKNVIAA